MEKIGYVRVSSDVQNEARQMAIMGKYGVSKIFMDKLSGKNMERPELKRMLEYVREDDALYVESISRVARSTKDLLEIVEVLQRKKVQLISDKENINTTTPSGKFALTIFAAIAELEREATLERVREGVAVAKIAGKYKGRPPRHLDEADKVFEDWKRKKITATAASKKLGISRASFYRRKNMFNTEYVCK